MRFHARIHAATLLATLLAIPPAIAQSPEAVKGVPDRADRRVVVDFGVLARQAAAAPQGLQRRKLIHEPLPVPKLPVPPEAIAPEAAFPPVPEATAPAPEEVRPRPGVLVTNFAALGDNNTTIPPDTNGAAGPNHLMVTLNSQVRIQNRSGGIISTVPLDGPGGFWAPLVGTSQIVFDPKVLYDPIANQWMFTACANPKATNSAVLIGVSQTSDPTGAWNLYEKDADAANVLWADYPSLGFNKDWIVVQVNMFPITTGTFRTQIYVFNKSDLYSGGTGLFTLFSQTSIGDTQVPAITYDNALAVEYLLQDWNGNFAGSGFLRLYSITGPVGSETLNNVSSNQIFPSTANPWSSFPPTDEFEPQLGSTRKISGNDSRIQDVVYRNGSLWTTHHVFLPAASPTRSSVQWWQITPSPAGGVPTGVSIDQFGRVDDPSAVIFRAFPTIGVNSANDVVIGYSQFSALQFASAAFASRSHSDPANTLTEAPLKSGEAKYDKDFGAGENRWGDFSATVVDPANDSDIWTIQEYAAMPSSGSDRWATWWGKVTFAPPPSLSIDDVSVTEGNSGTVTATFTVTLSPPSTSTVTVNYATANGTATTADGDYVATSGMLTFAPGETTKTIPVTVNGDVKYEDDETFFVNLSGATNAAIGDGQGKGTILNDDPAPSLSINDVVVTEGNSGSVGAVFTVSLSAVSGRTTTVSFATTDGTANAGSDYLAASGTLSFPPGTTTQTIMVSVLGDVMPEPTEYFFVDLSSPTNATLADSRGQGTIVNDDGRSALCLPIVSLPYTISAQGNYCLIQNLSTAITSGNAITVNSDFVNIDVKGFKIGGGGAGPGTRANGVYALNHKNITIKNGNIRGFFRAVFLEDNSGSFNVSQGHLVQGVRADENTYTGIEVQGRGNVVRSNQVVTTTGTTFFGANADAYGIHTLGSGVRILNNDVTDTVPQGSGAGLAIAVDHAEGTVIEKNRVGNSVAGNTYGVAVVSGDDVTVASNRIAIMQFGVYYDAATGKYRRNLTSGVAVPYTGGTDAGKNY
jgi:hypothetical protein